MLNRVFSACRDWTPKRWLLHWHQSVRKLRAFGYISAWGCKTISEVKAYSQNFSQRELMVIWPDFLAWDTVTSTTATAYATARALGLRARIDQEQGWHKTLSMSG